MLRILLIAVCASASLHVAHGATVRAESHPCANGTPLTGVVSKTLRGGGFTLLGSEQEYLLTGLMPTVQPETGTTVKLFPIGDKPDRYGRLSVQGFQRETWLQGSALLAGKALIFAQHQSKECLIKLRTAERTAQAAQSGLWANSNTELSASNLEALLGLRGKFALVKGKVLSVGDRPRRLYLNFGQKWSQDFTVSVVKQGAGAFKENTKGSLIRLSTLKGKTVRIRGVMEERQGPLIRLVNEAQIEILD